MDFFESKFYSESLRVNNQFRESDILIPQNYSDIKSVSYDKTFFKASPRNRDQIEVKFASYLIDKSPLKNSKRTSISVGNSPAGTFEINRKELKINQNTDESKYNEGHIFKEYTSAEAISKVLPKLTKANISATYTEIPDSDSPLPKTKPPQRAASVHALNYRAEVVKRRHPKTVVNESTINEDQNAHFSAYLLDILPSKTDIKPVLDHEHQDLLHTMLLGIQMAVSSSSLSYNTPLSQPDFESKFAYKLVPKRIEENKIDEICRFCDYSPAVFEKIRNMYGISNEDYLSSISPEPVLNNLSPGDIVPGEGKSGSFFFFSSDKKYTLKTISRPEFDF